jgi:hypothetical protein
MSKKLLLACLAIAAFGAFFIAPSASAVTFTDSQQPLAAGTSITAHSTGFFNFTGAFNVTCSTVHKTGRITKNLTSVVAWDVSKETVSFTGTGTSSDCTSALGSTSVSFNSGLCFESQAGDIMKATGCGANVVFTLAVTGTGPCKYSTASISGTFTTNSEPVTVTFTEQEAKLTEGGFFCPGSVKLDGSLDTYTTGSTPGGAHGAGISIS